MPEIIKTTIAKANSNPPLPFTSMHNTVKLKNIAPLITPNANSAPIPVVLK